MSETEVDLLVVKAQTADTFHDTEDDHRIELEARPTRVGLGATYVPHAQVVSAIIAKDSNRKVVNDEDLTISAPFDEGEESRSSAITKRTVKRFSVLEGLQIPGQPKKKKRKKKRSSETNKVSSKAESLSEEQKGPSNSAYNSTETAATGGESKSATASANQNTRDDAAALEEPTQSKQKNKKKKKRSRLKNLRKDNRPEHMKPSYLRIS